MRVIAGRFRGRTLDAPPGQSTRPITDRAKETLFNVLGHRFALPGCLPGFVVLDVFAGTGSLGLEALSRGAAACTFVEQDRRALRYLRQNIARLGADGACTVLTDNAWTMRPPPWRGNAGSSARVNWCRPNTLVSNWALKSSRETSSRAPAWQ